MTKNQTTEERATAQAPTGAPENFRRLECDELVNRGDYVKSAGEGLEIWEGPGGFRADAFVKAIYRRRTDSIRKK